MRELIAFLILAAALVTIAAVAVREHEPQKQMPLIRAKAPILARSYPLPCPVLPPAPKREIQA